MWSYITLLSDTPRCFGHKLVYKIWMCADKILTNDYNQVKSRIFYTIKIIKVESHKISMAIYKDFNYVTWQSLRLSNM